MRESGIVCKSLFGIFPDILRKIPIFANYNLTIHSTMKYSFRFFGSFSFIFLIAVAFLSVSCKTTKHAGKHKKPVQNPENPVTKTDTLTAWQKLESNFQAQAFQYKTLMLSGKMYAEMPKQGLDGMSVNYRVHLKKDSLIWMKISLLGIEGMRALITPDTIKLLDRQSNIAHIAPFSKVNQFLGLDVTFAHLQQMIVGNVPQICDAMLLKQSERMDYLAECEKDSFTFVYSIQRESYKLEKIFSEKKNPKISVNIDYSDFTPEVTQLFAHQIDMTLFSEKEGKNTVSLTHSKVEINPAELSFSFSIPANFKVQYD